MDRILYLRTQDDGSSPYRQHELQEPVRPRHYSDFLSERNDLRWVPCSPHSMRPRDLAENYCYAKKNHDCILAVAPSLFAFFAKGLGILRTPYFLVFWGNQSRSKLRRFVLAANFFLAERVIVNDRDTRDELLGQWKMAASKVCWLPLPVDTDYYLPASIPRGDYLLVPGDTKRDEEVTLAVAEGGPWQVVRSVKDGKGLSLYRGHPAIKAGRLVIKQWAVFSEIRANTQHALAVLLPLETCPEPVGLTALLEAMACGRPVIISSGRAARDHVVHGQTGFILQGDRSTWNAQIAGILAHGRDFLSLVGAQARAYVVARHSFASVSKTWAHTISKEVSTSV